MTRISSTIPTPDRSLMQFEVRDGIRRVACSVSDEALEAASGLVGPSTPALRRKSFDRYRTLIDAAAKLKLNTLPAGFAGPIVLSTRDLHCVPPAAGIPPFGSAPKGN